MTAIVLLNWNGATDTIACLESLYATETDFFVIIADNGSQDDSVARITSWLTANNINTVTLNRVGERTPQIATPPSNRDCVLLLNNENLGFAAGNNAALECIKPCTPDYVMLLNNDTLVTPGFLRTLTSWLDAHSEYVAATPRIQYNNPRHLVWNCGGKLYPGHRRYYYARKSYEEIREHDHIDITFITGCALIARRELLDTDNHLLTNRFFFGEEDFDFSISMSRAHRPMACVLDSLIYHKVNASVGKCSSNGKLYLHGLNRAINMRQHYGVFFYYLWLTIYSLYSTIRVLNAGASIRPLPSLFSHLWRDSRRHGSVTREMFQWALSQKEF